MTVQYDMTIASGWQAYMEFVLPDDASSVQQQDTRFAFYAGVAAALGVLARGGVDHEVLISCHEELDLFLREVEYREGVRMKQWSRLYESGMMRHGKPGMAWPGRARPG